uniref:Uncharacterized protein n=1 Tax=Plectus sambesii TaxID=2011161 RepID=A0A914VDR4_9BILA
MEDPNERRPKFGARVLDDASRVFEHNAWDHVEWPAEKEEEARRIVAKQREAPVADEKASALIASPSDYWNDFYETHDKKFFMDRNWLFTEFPE